MYTFPEKKKKSLFECSKCPRPTYIDNLLMVSWVVLVKMSLTESQTNTGYSLTFPDSSSPTTYNIYFRSKYLYVTEVKWYRQPGCHGSIRYCSMTVGRDLDCRPRKSGRKRTVTDETELLNYHCRPVTHGKPTKRKMHRTNLHSRRD